MSLANNTNPFYSPEDSKEIDDDTFLNHPRAGSSGYMLPLHRPNSAQRKSDLEERQRQLMMKKREIEERTLDSSNRSLGLLYESEKVGAATAEELDRQKEQLLRTEGRLDDINSTLNTSERHLQGIKSVFGGLKNYLFSRKSGLARQEPAAMLQHDPDLPVTTSRDSLTKRDEPESNNHPGLRVRSLTEGGNLDSVDDRIDRNLDQMSLSLSKLKGLAVNLNSELDEHNDIIDRLDDKSANTSWRVEKQNKDMAQLLKK